MTRVYVCMWLFVFCVYAYMFECVIVCGHEFQSRCFVYVLMCECMFEWMCNSSCVYLYVCMCDNMFLYEDMCISVSMRDCECKYVSECVLLWISLNVCLCVRVNECEFLCMSKCMSMFILLVWVCVLLCMFVYVY